MAFFTRPPIVEFRSLRSPPIRIHVRALFSLYRPQCLLSRQPAGRMPPCLAQRRCLTLYKTARATTTLGQHKILPFDLYQVPPPEDSEHLIHIVKADNTVVENISLKEAYDKHVEPGQILYLADEIPKKTANNIRQLQRENWQLKTRTYALLTAESLPHNLKSASSGHGQGALRVTPLSLSCSEHFKLCLDRSYQFIKQGCPVEFTFRLSGKHIKDKLKRLMPSDDVSQLEWMQSHFPHLRPDFILKAMPEGSLYLVKPVSNGRRIQFVIGPTQKKGFPLLPKQNLTKRLFNVKRAVESSIEKGLQGELPKVLRAKLADSGSKDYSPLTGKPLKLQRVEASGDTGEQELHRAMMASTDRYMPAVPQPALVKRRDKLTPAGTLSKPRYSKEHIRIKKRDKQKLTLGSGARNVSWGRGNHK